MRACVFLVLAVISRALAQEICTGCKKPIDFGLPYFEDDNGKCNVQSVIDNDQRENTLVFNFDDVSVRLEWVGIGTEYIVNSNTKLNNSSKYFECYKSYALGLLSDGFSTVPEKFNLSEIHYDSWTDLTPDTSLFQVIKLTDFQSEEMFLIVLYDLTEPCTTSTNGALNISLKMTGFDDDNDVEQITDCQNKHMFWIRKRRIIEGVDCGVPSPLDGQVYYSTTTLGSRAFYTCNRGNNPVNYIPVNMTRTCTADGAWSGPSTVCPEPRYCGCEAPEDVNNGVASSCQGCWVTYRCNTGFSMTGEESITCGDGIWSGTPPTCNATIPYTGDYFDKIFYRDSIEHMLTEYPPFRGFVYIYENGTVCFGRRQGPCISAVTNNLGIRETPEIGFFVNPSEEQFSTRETHIMEILSSSAIDCEETFNLQYMAVVTWRVTAPACGEPMTFQVGLVSDGVSKTYILMVQDHPHCEVEFQALRMNIQSADYEKKNPCVGKMMMDGTLLCDCIRAGQD